MKIKKDLIVILLVAIIIIVGNILVDLTTPKDFDFYMNISVNGEPPLRIDNSRRLGSFGNPVVIAPIRINNGTENRGNLFIELDYEFPELFDEDHIYYAAAKRSIGILTVKGNNQINQFDLLELITKTDYKSQFRDYQSVIRNYWGLKLSDVTSYGQAADDIVLIVEGAGVQLVYIMFFLHRSNIRLARNYLNGKQVNMNFTISTERGVV